MNLTEQIAIHQKAIEVRIAAACKQAGRSREDINLIWVSKFQAREKILAAQSLGAFHFGENKVQEALEKFPLPSPHTLHFIGHLQKNKLRKILPIAHIIHSVDSLALLELIHRAAVELKITREVFLQVNTSGESAKSGFSPVEIFTLAQSMRGLPGVKLIGLMTMGPQSENPVETRQCFHTLAQMLKDLRALYAGQPHPFSDLQFLSMGMTGDLEIAVEEGSHWLRIGTGLFGGRS